MSSLAVVFKENNKEPAVKVKKTHLRKMCFRKCKSCKGEKCPNFYGHLGTNQDYVNYSGVLHARKISFLEDIKKKKIPMDEFDWKLVYFLIAIVMILLVFGGLLP